MSKIKVKCIGSIMDQGYFAGEEYELEKSFYEANKNIFVPLTDDSNKVMTTADLNTKEETPAKKTK